MESSEHNETLVSEVAANSTFRSLLRTGNKTEQLYRDNKLLYPTKDFSQLPPKKGIESHIFDTNGPAERIVPGKKIRPIKDSIVFNDDYVETNPTIKYQKRRTTNSEIIQTEPSFNKKSTKFSSNVLNFKYRDMHFFKSELNILTTEVKKALEAQKKVIVLHAFLPQKLLL